MLSLQAAGLLLKVVVITDFIRAFFEPGIAALITVQQRGTEVLGDNSLWVCVKTQ